MAASVLAGLMVLLLAAAGARAEAASVAPAQPLPSDREFVPAADARLSTSDGLQRVRDDVAGSVHFDRGLDGPGRGFRWDSPGTRLRWRTDSRQVSVRLRYSSRHLGSSRNSVGVFRINGRSEPGWTFTRPGPGEAPLTVALPTPVGGGWHDYELILPYGDAVDLLGVEVEAGAGWGEPAARPACRYLAFGDSVTHGFTASSVVHTYAFQVAEQNGWQLLNLGIGGRGTHGPDGVVLAGIAAEVVSLLIGVNDWQGGADLASFRRNYAELLENFRAGRPDAPLCVITPLWVPPAWAPAAARHPLEAYRQVIREVVAARADPRLVLVEGPSLIDPDAALFDAVAVHPNDRGFAQLAQRLAPILAAAGNGP